MKLVSPVIFVNQYQSCVVQPSFRFLICSLIFRARVHRKTVLFSCVHCGIPVLRGNVSDTIESNLSGCLQVEKFSILPFLQKKNAF